MNRPYPYEGVKTLISAVEILPATGSQYQTRVFTRTVQQLPSHLFDSQAFLTNGTEWNWSSLEVTLGCGDLSHAICLLFKLLDRPSLSSIVGADRS